MIRVVFRQGRYTPRIFCDQCGQEISESGNYVWEVDEQHQPVTGELFFTHRECSRAFEEARGGRDRWFGGSLKDFPAYLARTLGMSLSDAIQAARFRSMFT